jgi:hypothetical protein
VRCGRRKESSPPASCAQVTYGYLEAMARAVLQALCRSRLLRLRGDTFSAVLDDLPLPRSQQVLCPAALPCRWLGVAASCLALQRSALCRSSASNSMWWHLLCYNGILQADLLAVHFSSKPLWNCAPNSTPAGCPTFLERMLTHPCTLTQPAPQHCTDAPCLLQGFFFHDGKSSLFLPSAYCRGPPS